MHFKGESLGVDDVKQLLRFANFFCWAAHHNRSFATCEETELSGFVNKSGLDAFACTGCIGGRVIADRIANKIVKFYSGKEAAQSALDNQRRLETVLGYSTNPQLIEGCGDGFSAIKADMLKEVNITYKHLIHLTEQVDLDEDLSC